MAANGIKSFVYILPNPSSSDPDHSDLNNISVAQRNLTFRIDITSDIYTLYYGQAQRGDDISGLAYVPAIGHEDECYHGHVPDNATQFNDLPALNFDLIGYAPWVSANCSQKYLASAAADKGNTRAVMFYTLTNGNKSAVMPLKSDPIFNLENPNYPFPIYVINGVDGEPLMQKISKYSRNMTDVWDSPGLQEKYDTHDFARVYIEVDTGTRNPLPGLWMFLLIVIGVLIFIFGFTSLVMHWIQYRHRVTLRRRLASGEVDLEVMGIKRLTVPLVILRRFPLRTYNAPPSSPPSPEPGAMEILKDIGSSRPSSTSSSSQSSRPQTPPAKVSKYAAPSPPLPPSPVITKKSKTPSTIVTTTPIPPLPAEPQTTALSLPDSHAPSHAFTQTNCAICLEEFESGISSVRELPCLHIFHPECIDPHLSTNSSLCPLCKASALPKGYVPANLTNQTVRRERNMRRMRERYAQINANGGVPPYRSRGWLNVFAFPSFLARRLEQREQNGDTEMGGGVGARRRGSFSAFTSIAPTQEEEDEEWRNMSLLRRLLKQAFPR